MKESHLHTHLSYLILSTRRIRYLSKQLYTHEQEIQSWMVTIINYISHRQIQLVRIHHYYLHHLHQQYDSNKNNRQIKGNLFLFRIFSSRISVITIQNLTFHYHRQLQMIQYHRHHIKIQLKLRKSILYQHGSSVLDIQIDHRQVDSLIFFIDSVDHNRISRSTSTKTEIMRYCRFETASNSIY